MYQSLQSLPKKQVIQTSNEMFDQVISEIQTNYDGRQGSTIEMVRHQSSVHMADDADKPEQNTKIHELLSRASQIHQSQQGSLISRMSCLPNKQQTKRVDFDHLELRSSPDQVV